jgi:hypothetical protein
MIGATLPRAALCFGTQARPQEEGRLARAKSAVNLVLVAVIFLPMFGVPITQDFSAGFGLVAVYWLLITLSFNGMVGIERTSLLLFAMAALAGLSSIATNASSYISVPSFGLLLVLYIPFLFSLSQQLDRREMLDFAMRRFCGLAFVLAICAIVQFALQFVIHDRWLFNITSLIPPGLRAAGVWNHAIPTNGIYKANGFFQREPSGLSVILGIALLVEFLRYRRPWRMAGLGLAMILSYSGSGFLLLAVGLLLPTSAKSAGRAVLLMAGAAIFWLAFHDLLQLDSFLGRVSEFSTPNTSGYARFIAPFDMIRYGFDASWWHSVFGHGPGTIQPAIDRYRTTFAIHDPTWAKLIFEYGVAGALAMLLFVGQALFRSGVARELKIAILYSWLAAGGLLLSPDFTALMFALVTLWPALADQKSGPTARPFAPLARVRPRI